MKSWLRYGLLVLILLPAFGLMLHPGIYTMHDPHVFRAQQFDQCVKDMVFPCRWAPDSGKGYGEPMFNFYAQFPYWVITLFRLLQFSILDSVKLTFIFTLVASAISMYCLARKYWGNLGGAVSAVFYVYAPYRAVDIWVRGALPEAMAFVWYPLIVLFLDLAISTKRNIYFILFSLFVSLLITTHNLSFMMFLPFLGVFSVYKILTSHNFSSVYSLLKSIAMVLALTGYYWIPVVVESHLVTLEETVNGYYNFRIHFTTLKELFIDRYWGYGASLWARKYLSVSIGHLHWVLPLVMVPLAILRRQYKYLLIFILGMLALFMTHGKSSAIWNVIEPMKYIQFPWRYLTVAVFFLSLASGYVSIIISKKILIVLLITSVVLINYGFFRPDIWRNISDNDQFSGELWDEGRSSSLSDFWPKSSSILPVQFAPTDAEFVSGLGGTLRSKKYSHSAEYDLLVTSESAVVNLPIVYFPGWTVTIDQKVIPIQISKPLGLIPLNLSEGSHNVNLLFTNTAARLIGNLTSALGLFIIFIWLLKIKLG